MSAEPPPPRPGPGPGPDVPGLEPVDVIGSGASGTVWRCRQDRFQREVAVKVVDTRLNERSAEQFARECKALGAMSGHPNIVQVYDGGADRAGRPYLVMPYLSRGSLAEEIAHGPMPWPRAVDIGVRLAGALQVAHDGGILHRDVKPENVLLGRFGEPQLADFGLARLQGAFVTTAGTVTGTLVHAAPEIIDGKPASVASDVYSLASTVYRLIAGRAAFYADTDESILPLLARIATQEAPDLRGLGAPPLLAESVRAGMSKDPAARPRTAAEFGARLQEVQRQSGLPVTVVPGVPRPGAERTDPYRPGKDPLNPGSEPVLPPGGPRRGLVVAAAVLLVVAAGATVAGVALTRDHSTVATSPTSPSVGPPMSTPSSLPPTTDPPTTDPPTTDDPSSDTLDAAAAGALLQGSDLSDLGNWTPAAAVPTDTLPIRVCNASFSSDTQRSTLHGVTLDGAPGEFLNNQVAAYTGDGAVSAMDDYRASIAACSTFDDTNYGDRIVSVTSLPDPQVGDDVVAVELNYTDASTGVLVFHSRLVVVRVGRYVSATIIASRSGEVSDDVADTVASAAARLLSTAPQSA